MKEGVWLCCNVFLIIIIIIINCLSPDISQKEEKEKNFFLTFIFNLTHQENQRISNNGFAPPSFPFFPPLFPSSTSLSFINTPSYDHDPFSYFPPSSTPPPFPPPSPLPPLFFSCCLFLLIFLFLISFFFLSFFFSIKI